MRFQARPIEAVVLLTAALYFGYGALVNFATLGLVNGLASALGGCCAPPGGASAVGGLWKLFLLGALFLIAFVTSLSVGVGAFTGVPWLAKGMRIAGGLGAVCCCLSLLIWGFDGFAKYVFLIASLYILLQAAHCRPVVAVAVPREEMT